MVDNLIQSSLTTKSRHDGFKLLLFNNPLQYVPGKPAQVKALHDILAMNEPVPSPESARQYPAPLPGLLLPW